MQNMRTLASPNFLAVGNNMQGGSFNSSSGSAKMDSISGDGAFGMNNLKETAGSKDSF